jgi:putative PIN family toxin of toxin-antitoxin system
MPSPKIVVDSNVFVSALLWVGAPHQILKFAENHNLIIYSSMEIIDEVANVLERPKFQKRINELNASPAELMEALLGTVEIVRPNKKYQAVAMDPDDNKIIDCAVAAVADCIITGDPHLLKLKVFLNMPIITPRQFIQKPL